MPRTIGDLFELPDDDGELPLEGKLARRPPPPIGAFALLVVLAALAAVAVYAYTDISARQEDDAYCLSCHTTQHTTYYERGENAIAGALAVDLSSYHYQQIRGQGGNIRCIQCHRGDDGTRARVATVALSARMSVNWLLRGNEAALEASARVITATNGVTSVLGTALLRAPHLTTGGCVACHSETLLIAGIENHMHNTLPAAYSLWKNGARLVPPRSDSVDAQAILARGLVSYDTTVQCGDCHQAHRSTDEDKYMHQPTVQRTCVQCHTDAGVTP
jgi:predicted CXXCH cytochrome family protein